MAGGVGIHDQPGKVGLLKFCKVSYGLEWKLLLSVVSTACAAGMLHAACRHGARGGWGLSQVLNIGDRFFVDTLEIGADRSQN